jgi:hypothetical protein
MDRDLTYLKKGDMVCIPMQEPPRIGIVLMTPPITATFVKILHDQRIDWWHKTDCEILSDV